MAKLSSILNDRFMKKEKTKMSSLAKQSTDGALTSFSGIFGVAKISDEERAKLAELLRSFSEEGQEVDEDLVKLSALTSEVRAIQNQAAILHGERIKKAQEILKNYREGAFSAWLLATYGNRQTPYNFLQYHEFYLKMPKDLHPQIEAMPRQAIYTLASRDGELAKKVEIIRSYKGESKEELLLQIRTVFPLIESDKRREDLAARTIKELQKLLFSFERRKVKMNKKQKEQTLSLLERLSELANEF